MLAALLALLAPAVHSPAVHPGAGQSGAGQSGAGQPAAGQSSAAKDTGHGFGSADADRLRALVMPDASELAWEAIPWIPRFHEGLDAAHRAQSPVLLWVMNGHPLGCT